MLAAFFQRQALSIQRDPPDVVDIDCVTSVSCHHDHCGWNDAVVLSSRSACPSGKSLLWRVQIPESLAGTYTVPGQFVKLRWNDTVEPLFLAMCSPPVSYTPQVVSSNHHRTTTITTTPHHEYPTHTSDDSNDTSTSNTIRTSSPDDNNSSAATADGINGNTRHRCVFEFLVKTTPNITWLSNIGSGTRVQVSQVYGNGFPLLVPISLIPPCTTLTTSCSSPQQQDNDNDEVQPFQDDGHCDSNGEHQQQEHIVGRQGILLVAAGSGIAPLKACIESGQLQSIVGPDGDDQSNGSTNNNKKKIRFYRLYYGEWTQDDLCFPELFDTWKVKYGIEIIPCLSRSPDGMGHVQNALRRDLCAQDGGDGDHGDITPITTYTPKLLQSAGTATKSSLGATAFLCGMDDMVVTVTELLQEAGVPPERILINL